MVFKVRAERSRWSSTKRMNEPPDFLENAICTPCPCCHLTLPFPESQTSESSSSKFVGRLLGHFLTSWTPTGFTTDLDEPIHACCRTMLLEVMIFSTHHVMMFSRGFRWHLSIYTRGDFSFENLGLYESPDIPLQNGVWQPHLLQEVTE